MSNHFQDAALYGRILVDELSSFGAPRLRVQKNWRMMCIPEWWVVRNLQPVQLWMNEEVDLPPAKIAGPFKTKQAAQAALSMMQES